MNMKYSLIIILCLLFFLSIKLNGQSAKYFDKTYESKPYYTNENIISKSDSFIVGGYTGNYDLPDESFKGFLLGVNSYGKLKQEYIYEQAGEEELYIHKVIDIDTAILLVGRTEVNFADFAHTFYKIIDFEGQELLAYEQDTIFLKTSFQDGIITKDNGLLVSGYSDTDEGLTANLLKFDSLGQLEWDTVYLDFLPVNSTMGRIRLAENNNYYIALGIRYSMFSSDAYLWETDSLGNRIRFKEFNYSAKEGISNFIATKDGGILLLLSGDSGIRRIIKLNKDWEDEFVIKDHCENGYLKGLLELEDSTFVIFGSYRNYDEDWNEHLDDFQLIKLDKNGEVLWIRTYVNFAWDTAIELLRTDDSGFLMMGNNRYDKDQLHLIKTNCMGLLTEPETSFTYNNLGSQEVAFTNTSLYVYSDSIDGGYYEWDFGDGSAVSNAVNPVHSYSEEGEYTVRLTGIVCSDTSVYEQTILATPTSVVSPASPSLSDALRIYPNPVDGDVLYFELNLQISPLSLRDISPEGRILIYNTLGQVVLQREKSRIFSKGKHEIDVSALPGGVYFVVVEIGGERVIDKVVIE